MSGKWLLLAVLSCATILAVSAVAQDEKNELGGTFGHAFISDQGISGAYFSTRSFTPAGDGASTSEYSRHLLVTPLVSFPAKWSLMYNPGSGLECGISDQSRLYPHRL